MNSNQDHRKTTFLGLCGSDAVEEGMRLAYEAAKFYHDWWDMKAEGQGAWASSDTYKALRAHLSRMAGTAPAVSREAQVKEWITTIEQAHDECHAGEHASARSILRDLREDMLAQQADGGTAGETKP